MPATTYDNLRLISTREVLARALGFLYSRNRTDLALTQCPDDFRDMELERLEGPEDRLHPLIRHTNRLLSEKEMVEQIRQGMLSVIGSLRNQT